MEQAQNQPSTPAPDTPSQPASQVNHVAQPIIIQQQSVFLRVLVWIGWAGFLFCFLLLLGLQATMSEYFDTSGGITEKFHSGDQQASDKIAVITLKGVIMEGDGFVKRQIDRVREDDDVKAIVLRVDSPGGTVTGSDYMLHHLKKLREEKTVDGKPMPLVVSMGSFATSGGYYVSMAVGDQEKSIYAEPTTTTGSIGVIIPHYDITGLMERFDIKDDSIVSHERKQMLSMTRKISDDQRAILQAYIDETFERFKGIVVEGRPQFASDEEALNMLATGEIFTAGQAQKLGLVDELGFIEDAVKRARELAGLSDIETRVVEYERPPSFLDLSTLSQSRPSGVSVDLGSLVELSTPRAWFLTTSLPVLVSTRP